MYSLFENKCLMSTVGFFFWFFLLQPSIKKIPDEWDAQIHARTQQDSYKACEEAPVIGA